MTSTQVIKCTRHGQQWAKLPSVNQSVVPVGLPANRKLRGGPTDWPEFEVRRQFWTGPRDMGPIRFRLALTAHYAVPLIAYRDRSTSLAKSITRPCPPCAARMAAAGNISRRLRCGHSRLLAVLAPLRSLQHQTSGWPTTKELRRDLINTSALPVPISIFSMRPVAPRFPLDLQFVSRISASFPSRANCDGDY